MNKKRQTRRKRYRILTTSDVAAILKCSVDEVRRLEGDGEIVAERTRKGHRRYDPASVEAYRRHRTAPRRQSTARKPKQGPPEPRPTVHEEPLPPELEEILDEEEGLRALAEERAASRPPLPPPTFQDQMRLDMLKFYGTCSIPWDVPPEWRQKVSDDLDRFVTYERFPPTHPLDDAPNAAIQARVNEVLAPYRKDAARRQEAEERRQTLIAYGRDHTRHITASWDYSSRSKALREVDRVLNAEVKPTMTEREVRLMADEILDKYSEDGEGD